MTQRNKNDQNFWIWIKFGLFALILVIVIFGCFRSIPAGHKGVMLTFGKANEIPLDEGLNFKIPLAQKIVRMSVQTLKYESGAGAASKDLQIVSTTIAVNYHLNADTVAMLYKEIGIDYSVRVIQPAVQEVVKAATAKFTAEELITKRPEVKDLIKIELKERLDIRGIFVEDISITNFDFSESFNKAIEAKVEAEQLKLKAERDLQRIMVEAEQKITQAEAEAESIRIQSKALNENPDILQLRAIEKWDGVLPKVTGGATPFIDITEEIK